jgi:tuberculosinol/isotuberculosinol synthase
MVNFEAFQNLPTHEVADMVRSSGTKVCAFPTDGTRRWYLLEHPGDSSTEEFLDIEMKRHIELYKLFFDHGVDTIIAPVVRPDLMDRKDGYWLGALSGLALMANHSDFLEFYRNYNIRLHIYGEYRDYLYKEHYEDLLECFDEITSLTRSHKRHHLFFGLFLGDPTESITKLTINFHLKNGIAPNKRELIEMFYGEYVDPVDIFIGFGRFCIHDAPLLLGNEDLYFTLSPSLYMTQQQLRRILYDHLYKKQKKMLDYNCLGSEEKDKMRKYYHDKSDEIFRVGENRGVLMHF